VCSDECVPECTEDQSIALYQGHPLLDGAEDFELGEACELGDTDCESCQ
jgi:hypothetical protein